MKTNFFIITINLFIYAFAFGQDGSGSEGEWHAMYLPGEGNQSVELAADEEAWITRLDYTWGVGKLGVQETRSNNRFSNSSISASIASTTIEKSTPDIRLLFQNPGDSGLGTIHTGRTFGYADRIWVPGPRTIYLKSETAGAIVTCHVVVKKKANEVTKKFATVIPENAAGNVDIILEQSTDLINWSAVNPGSFTPNAAKRFFRVRSEEE
jgi:hypothetical protein